jgi:asparaginyl-tRNA synthetase
MDLITVRELFKNTDAYACKTVTVGGWVRNRRPSKQFGFIVLNDGTYFTPVQVVYDDTIENFQEISKINIGAALIVEGEVVLTPDSKQPFELKAKTVTVEVEKPLTRWQGYLQTCGMIANLFVIVLVGTWFMKRR